MCQDFFYFYPMEETVYPAAFARFYDVLYKKIRTQDEDFYLAQMTATQGPVLEIGSGTGRLLSRALAAGMDVYGLEPSEHMIKVCKSKLAAADHSRIFQGFVESMDLGKQFDLIVAPFRVFQHLHSQEQQLKALERVHAHLKPGGRFIFDAFVPDMDFLNKGKQTLHDFDGEWKPGCKLQRFINVAPDIPGQTQHLWFNFHWQEAPNGDFTVETWKSSLHLFNLAELKLLVKASSLQLEKIEGDFAGNALGKNSKDFVVFCRKG